MKFILAAVVISLGYLLAFKAIPFVFTRVGRLLGFRMRVTPLTAKRIARFKTIRRGYLSFVALTTLFTTSFFLEILVNHKPLYIRYGDTTAYPAVRDLGNLFLSFACPFVDFDRSSEFGLPGEGRLDYRRFSAAIEDPSREFAALIEEKQAEIERTRQEFASLREEIDALRADGEEPEEWELEELASADRVLAQLTSDAEVLEANEATFAEGGAAILWPLYPFSAEVTRLDLPASAPFPPTLLKRKNKQGEPLPVEWWEVPLGTDPSGIDVVPQLLYGFRISFAFAAMVLVIGYAFGILVGAVMGYFGGWIDISVQRVVEVWGSIPFLFTIMIIVEITRPGFWVLAGLLIVLSAWLGITYLIRGEFYREKAKDYVQAAIGTGVSERKVILKHILPNSMVPVVSTAPFAFVAFINALVSLDYLGYGLPAGTPSWGAMLRNAKPYLVTDPHLALIPVTTLAITLLMAVMIGEAVREGFDPKVFSRLR